MTMKTKKNMIWMAVATVAAMAMAACSNADDFGEASGDEVAGDHIVTLTATLSAKGGDDAMRSVDVNGVTTWVVGEELMLQYDQTPSGSASAKATVTAVTGGVATIKATLVNPKNGGEVQLDYPYSYADPGSTIDILTDQDGTIDKISQYFDYARDAYHATGIGSSYTLTVVGSEATIPSNIVMKNTNCIWKFKFKDGANDITNKINKLVINDGSGDYTITPSGLSEICVSLFPASSLNITITATTTDSKIYAYSKSGVTLAAGKLYESTVALTETGELAGLFSVSDTKKVRFSKGNLRYETDYARWSFFDYQYKFTPNYTVSNWDKFGWSTSTTNYGMNTSTTYTDYSGSFKEWGATIGTGWRTLEKLEWMYLLGQGPGTRTGTLFCKATVASYNGLVIFPDGYTHPTGVSAINSANNKTANYTANSWSSTDWTAMEAAGAVFLPAAADREGESVGWGQTKGCYWTSDNSGSTYAVRLYFTSFELTIPNEASRHIGCSVRLVHDVE